MHATDGSVILTGAGKPVECHIYRLNYYANKCHGRENSDIQGNKYKSPGTSPVPPTPLK